MKGINKVILVGTICHEIELIEFTTGKKTMNLSVVTNEYYTDKNGEKKQEAEWHRVVCWDKTAELIKKLFVKGDKIYIEGKLRTKSYERQGSQEKVKVTEILICEFVKC